MRRIVEVTRKDLLDRFKNTEPENLSFDKFRVELIEFAKAHEVRFITTDLQIKYLKRL